MITKDLIHALRYAYELPALDSITQIHDGTHRVYRLDWKNNSAQQHVAVKISTSLATDSFTGKQVEQSVLQQLHKKLTFIPTLLMPVNEPANTKCFSWGLCWQNDTVVTCYQWVPAYRYSGSKRQMKSAAYHFALLENALLKINGLEASRHTILQLNPRIHFNHNQILLDDNFTFSIFQDFIDSLASTDTTIIFLKNSLTYLQQEMDELHLDIQYGSLSNYEPGQWVHLELSPSNFGFDSESDVNCIFDFDSLNRGLFLQDLGWFLATFCIDYRFSVTQAVDKISNMLPVILSNLKLQDDWQDYLLVFMRMGYLDTIYRKILRYQNGEDIRLGFVKQDIQTLRWLRRHQTQLIRHIQGF